MNCGGVSLWEADGKCSPSTGLEGSPGAWQSVLGFAGDGMRVLEEAWENHRA